MQRRIRRDVALLLAVSVAAVGACAMRGPALGAGSGVRPGISVLLTDSIHLIRGKRVGLLTNQTGVDEHGESDIERLRAAEARAAGVQLVRLFSPEHGIRGTEDREQLASGIDERSGLVIQSLYANGTIAPPDSTLRDLDVLVVDLQDIGTRTWTYVGAMLYAMKAAARRGIADHRAGSPEPAERRASGWPVLDSALANPDEPTPSRPGRAFALYPTPLRHGLTMGELARYFNAELKIGADLHVVPAAGWRRAMWFDETGLPWVRPSPNLPTLASATVYPALVAFEGSNLSVGRGTPDAFQAFGAPWLPADGVAARSTRAVCPGVRFERHDLAPRAAGDGKYSGQTIPGVRIVVTDRDRFSAGRTGAAHPVGRPARPRRTPSSCAARSFDDRFGRPAMREALMRGEDPDRVVARDSAAVWRGGARWRDTRSIDKSLPSWASHVSCTERSPPPVHSARIENRIHDRTHESSAAHRRVRRAGRLRPSPGRGQNGSRADRVDQAAPSVQLTNNLSQAVNVYVTVDRRQRAVPAPGRGEHGREGARAGVASGKHGDVQGRHRRRVAHLPEPELAAQRLSSSGACPDAGHFVSSRLPRALVAGSS